MLASYLRGRRFEFLWRLESIIYKLRTFLNVLQQYSSLIVKEDILMNPAVEDCRIMSEWWTVAQTLFL